MSAVPVRQRVWVALMQAWPKVVTARQLEAAGVTSERAAMRALNELTEMGKAIKEPARRHPFPEPATFLALMPVPDTGGNDD